MQTSPLAPLHDSLHDGLRFCAKVYEIFERIRVSPDGPDRLRMRASDTEKRVIEELLPICKYLQTKYRAGRYISIRWLQGSQQFDGILEQRGWYVEQGYFPTACHVEVTSAVHSNDYLSRELLTKSGVAYGVEGLSRTKSRAIASQPVVHTNSEHVDAFVPIVLTQISKKAAIAYPEGAVLIIRCSLNTLYTPDEWQELCGKVQIALPQHSFREIFLCEPVFDYCASL